MYMYVLYLGEGDIRHLHDHLNIKKLYNIYKKHTSIKKLQIFGTVGKE